MSLAAYRERFPQYADVPDAALVGALHKKYGSDMTLEQFGQAVGYKPDVGLLQAAGRGLAQSFSDTGRTLALAGTGGAMLGERLTQDLERALPAFEQALAAGGRDPETGRALEGYDSIDAVLAGMDRPSSYDAAVNNLSDLMLGVHNFLTGEGYDAARTEAAARPVIERVVEPVTEQSRRLALNPAKENAGIGDMVANVAGYLGGILPQAIALGAGGPAAAPAASGLANVVRNVIQGIKGGQAFAAPMTATRVQDLAEQGVPPETLAKVAATNYPIHTLEAALPVSVPGRALTRAATGAAGNIALGAGQRAAEAQVLGPEHANLAEPALSPQAATLEGGLGASMALAFGGRGAGAARPRPPAPGGPAAQAPPPQAQAPALDPTTTQRAIEKALLPGTRMRPVAASAAPAPPAPPPAPTRPAPPPQPAASPQGLADVVRAVADQDRAQAPQAAPPARPAAAPPEAVQPQPAPAPAVPAPAQTLEQRGGAGTPDPFAAARENREKVGAWVAANPDAGFEADAPRMGEGKRMTVTPSTKGPGWQVTTWDAQGPVGDMQFRTHAEAVDAARLYGGIDLAAVRPEPAPRPQAPEPAPAPQAPARPPVQATGIEEVVYTARGDEHPVRWEVIEADELVSSHAPDGRVNPDYPPEMQPRDRTREASQLQIKKISANLKPELLAESATAGEGAPIIGPDRVVESGNGRVAAIRQAYAGENGAKYRAYILENSGRFGVSDERIAGMRNPVLVRVREGGGDRAAFARDANQATVAPMAAAERARADAAALTDDLVAAYAPDEMGNPLAASNEEFLRGFARVIGEQEAGGLRTGDGRWTKQMADRVQAAIFERAYGNPRLLEAMAEEADPDVRNVLNALGRAAPAFARARSLGADKATMDAIGEAVEIVRIARRSGQAVDEALAQADAFTQPSPAAALVADFLGRNVRSAKRMTEALRRTAEVLEQEARNQQSGSLFGDAPLTPEQIARAGVEEADGRPQGALFEEPEPRPAAAGAGSRYRGWQSPTDQRADAAAAADAGGDQAGGTAGRAPPAAVGTAEQRAGQPRVAPRGGMLREQAQATTRGILEAWTNAPGVRVVQSVAELPDPDAPANARGAYHNGQVWLVADNLADDGAVFRTMLHEVVGHDGVRRLLGDRFEPTMQMVYRELAAGSFRGEGMTLKQLARHLSDADGRPLDLSVPANRLLAAEEYVAYLAEGGAKSSALDTVITRVYQAIRRINPNLRMTKAEVRDLLARSRRLVEAEDTGGRTLGGLEPGGLRAARAPEGREGLYQEIRDDSPPDLADMKRLAKQVTNLESRMAAAHRPAATRAQATTREANLGKLAQVRDGARQALADRIRDNLRAGRDVPQDLRDVAGAAVDYNAKGDYDPVARGAERPQATTESLAATLGARFPDLTWRADGDLLYAELPGSRPSKQRLDAFGVALREAIAEAEAAGFSASRVRFGPRKTKRRHTYEGSTSGTRAYDSIRGQEGAIRLRPRTDETLLRSPTSDELRARDESLAAGERARERADRTAEQRAAADRERDSFELTGSDLPADRLPRQGTLFARGQQPDADTPMARQADAPRYITSLRALDMGEGYPETLPDGHALLRSTDQIDTPERQALRDQIVAEQTAVARPVEGRRPIAYVMGGGGASGKGTVLHGLVARGQVPDEHTIPHLDPDAIKARLPEYGELQRIGDGRAAAVVHEESSTLAGRAFDRIRQMRSDMVVDRTLGKPDKAVAELEALRDAGYEVRLFGITVQPDEAVRRAAGRARKSGRWVPADVLRAAHRGFAEGFERLARLADEAHLFDNNGTEPVQIARAIGGELQVSDPSRYTAFREVGNAQARPQGPGRHVEPAGSPVLERGVGGGPSGPRGPGDGAPARGPFAAAPAPAEGLTRPRYARAEPPEAAPEGEAASRAGEAVATVASAARRWEATADRIVWQPAARVAKQILGHRMIRLADTSPPEFKQMLREYRAQVLKAGRRAEELAKAGEGLPPGERELISGFIERELAAGEVPPDHIVEIATQMQAALRDQGDELVRLGMLSPESRDRLGDRYLARYYAKHLVDNPLDKTLRMLHRRSIEGSRLKGRGIFETITAGEWPKYQRLGWELRSGLNESIEGLPKHEKVRIWRDYTPEERRRMGEIRDGVYRYVRGYLEAQKDVALGRLFENIATSEHARNVRPGEDWVQVPDTRIADTGGVRRYGALSGKWVPRDVWDHLRSMRASDPESFGHQLYGVYAQALSAWKEGKTAMNPVVHSNNVISNVVMADLAGVAPWEVGRYHAALKEYRNRGPMYREALDAGLFGTEFYGQEIGQMVPALEAFRDVETAAAGWASKALEYAARYTGASAYRKAMGRWYQGEDQYFKLLVYMKEREGGASKAQAVDTAERFFFNYADIPQGVRVLKATALPFLSYGYKALPALLHAVVHTPWRFAKWVAVFGGANWAAYEALFGPAGDEREEIERELLPDYLKGDTAIPGVAKAMRLPWHGANGESEFLDLSRRMPLGDLFDMHNQAGGVGLPAPIMPNNPVLTLFGGLVWNVDAFRGREVVTDVDPEPIATRAGWALRQILPNTPLLPGSYSWNKVMNGVAGSTGNTLDLGPLGEFTGKDYYGREQSLPRALADTVTGFKVRSVDLENEQRRRLLDVRRDMGLLRGQMRSAVRDQRLSDDTRAARLEELRQQMLKLADEAAKIPRP